jgi:phosphohistidine phosphatase SixA
MVRSARIVLVMLAAAFWSLPALGQGAPAQAEWLDALREGGHVIVLLHATTNQDQADTDPLNFGNIDQQRQLSDEGRAMAMQIGEAFTKLGIPISEIRTSMFNRAIDTGWLAFGDATPTLDLTDGGLAVTPIENDRRAQALRKRVATVPPEGTNVVLVTHRANMLDAFGKDWFDIREGEASIFKPDGRGGFLLVVRVPADAWSPLAKAAN